MLYAIIFYALTTLIVIFALNRKKYATKEFPPLKMFKYGMCFFSTTRHKIKTGQVKILAINTITYLKTNNKTVVLKNVENVMQKGDYVYFTALGEVKIIFNAKSFYRYFNIKILSQDFDLSQMQSATLRELLDNLFNLQNCERLKEYLNIVIKILNIKITDNKVVIKKNKYNLSFQLIYRLNNINKIINIDSEF